MARYTHPDVKEYVESASGERVRLALVPSESGAPDLRERLGQIEADIERELPSGVMLIEISVSQLPPLFDVEDIESISPAEGMEVLD